MTDDSIVPVDPNPSDVPSGDTQAHLHELWETASEAGEAGKAAMELASDAASQAADKAAVVVKKGLNLIDTFGKWSRESGEWVQEKLEILKGLGFWALLVWFAVTSTAGVIVLTTVFRSETMNTFIDAVPALVIGAILTAIAYAISKDVGGPIASGLLSVTVVVVLYNVVHPTLRQVIDPVKGVISNRLIGDEPAAAQVVPSSPVQLEEQLIVHIYGYRNEEYVGLGPEDETTDLNAPQVFEISFAAMAVQVSDGWAVVGINDDGTEQWRVQEEMRELKDFETSTRVIMVRYPFVIP